MTRGLALITGGTSGIGMGVAQALAPYYDLALGFASNEQKANESVTFLQAQFPGLQVRTFKKILSTQSDCAELYRDVCQGFGKTPQILVNSAGRLKDGLFLNSDFDSFRSVIDEHLVATMALTQIALKEMYKNKFGRIVNLSSISSFYAKRGQTNYAAAKAGIEGFTKCLALEVAHRGITVNAIAPGLIETPMTQELAARIEASERGIRKTIPAGRLGQASEVGALVGFLCSAQAGYITGTVIPIDGGRSLGDPQS